MPWHSGSTNALGMELAVHYHILDGQRVPVRDQRKSAAILTIDSNNVNVIGPASIAQRLMFAAMAAAAAAPQNESSKYQYNVQIRPMSSVSHTECKGSWPSSLHRRQPWHLCLLC